MANLFDLSQKKNTNNVNIKSNTSKPLFDLSSGIKQVSQPTVNEPTAPSITPVETPIVTPPKKNIFQKYATWSEETGKAIGNWEKAKVLNFVESAKEKLANVGLYDYSKEYDVTKDTIKPTIEELKSQKATIGYPKHNLIDPFMAGIGDVEQVTGSTMLWLNKKLEASNSKLNGLKQITYGAGKALQEEGEEMQGKYTDIKAQQALGEFDWGDMLNPSWYHQNVLRAVPFSLALVPASLAAGSVGSMAGLGAFGTFVVSSILGGNTRRGLESATEAGTVYDELRKQGLSHEEADQQANEVFKKNMSLTGLDIGEFALTFMPGGKKIKSILPKGILSTGRVAFTGAMGGGEELLQKKFQDEAEGKKFSWKDPETKASAIIGTLMGGGLTTGALVVEGFKSKVLENLPENMKGNGTTDKDNLEEIAQQYPEETKTAIQEAVKETAKEEDEKIEAMSKIVEDVQESLKTKSVQTVAQELRNAGFSMKAIDVIISTSTSQEPATIDLGSASKQAEMAADAIEQQYTTQEVTPNMKSTIREAVKEFGPEKAISTLIEDFEMSKTQAETLVQQALNEAGSTLEETKTPEAVTEQPKLKKTQEQSLIEEARNFKTPAEFASSKRTVESNTKVFEDNQKAQLDLISKNEVVVKKSLSSNKWLYDVGDGNLLTSPFSSKEKTLEYANSERQKSIDYLKTDYVKDNTSGLNKVLPEKSYYEDIWNKAQGEAKMKISDKVSHEDKIKISKLLEGLDTTPATVNGKPLLEDTELYFRLDQLKTKESTKGLNEEEYIEIKGLLEEVGLGLDTLKTKEDNKTYEQGTRYNRGVDEGIQNDENGDKRGDTKPSLYSLESEGWRQVPIVRRQTQGYTEPTNRQLPKKKEPGEIKKIVSEFLHDAKLETVNKIVDFYIKADEVGMLLTIQRTNVLNGRSDFAAGMDSSNTEFVLSLKDSDMANIKPSDIRHEWGHSYWSSIGDYGRQDIWSRIKWDYKKRKELYDTFEYKDMYWADNIKFIKYHIYDANLKAGKTAGSLEVNPILREVGLLDENNKVIIPEDVIEASFSFGETNKKINELLVKNGLETSLMTDEHNNLMADEINAFIFENIEEFNENSSAEIFPYTHRVFSNSLSFGQLLEPTRVHFRRPGTDIEYGGTRLKLKSSTGLTSEDIIKKHANIQLKRDIVITDVYGEKVTLKAGEGITPYEVTGNKFILQDGEAYLVSKSQAENVINNSKTSEAKPFAPELKQTEETVKGGKIIKNSKEYNKLNKEYNKLNEERWNAMNKGNNPLVVELDKKLSILNSQMNKMENIPTKYSQYTLPGGENYREILIKAPVEGGFDVTKLTPKDLTVEETKYSQTQRGAMVYYKGKPILKEELWWRDNESEEDVKQQALDLASKYKNFAKPQEGFRSSHWSELNVIAHLRMNWRKFKGSSVAFMEELQSDWAREGRDKGFSKEITKETAKEQGFTVEKSKSTTGEEAYFIDNTTDEFFYRKGFENTGFDTEAEAWDSIISKLKETTGAVPNNPLLKNWQELSIKRALQEAVNSNAKYFAWINGPQTAARYNLSKEVDNIKWISSDIDGVKNVGILPKGGSLIAINVDANGKVTSTDKGDWKGKKLDEVIGKGVAEKIMASPKGKLEGEGLNMGGEWATNLYDRQVRTIVENLTGQKVEMLDMGLNELNNKYTLSHKDGSQSSQKLVSSSIKEGVQIHGPSPEYPNGPTKAWIVTDIIGEGKFKAVPANQLAKSDIEAIQNGTLDEESKDILDTDEEGLKKTFDISTKQTSQQMGIEITPEVKQIINGEAPQVKVSGKLPFTEQITAPVMFKLKAEDPLINEARKYKTPEEFIKSQGDIVYHGTSETFDIFDDKMKGSITGAKSAHGATWFTDSQEVAKAYSIYAAETGPINKLLKEHDILEKIAQRSGKNSDWEKVDILTQKIDDLGGYDATYDRRVNANVKEAIVYGDFYKIDAKGKTPQELSADGDIDSWLNLQVEKAKKLGKDGLIIKNIDDAVGLYDTPSTHYAVFDTKNIKTRSQLIEIWNIANQIEPAKLKIKKPTLEELKTNLQNTQKALDKAVANPEVYGQNSIVNLNQKVADLRRAIMEEKYPNVDTGDKITDARTVLANIESKLGVSSLVNSIKEKEMAIEIGKEVLDNSPMKELEPYVADAGDYKGTLPEVTGKSIEEIKQNKAFRGVKNEKAIKYASSGDEIAQEIAHNYGMEMDSNEIKEEFEDYQKRKDNLKEEEKKIKQEKLRFGKVDTFELLGKDKTLTSEILGTRDIPKPIKDIMNLVKEEKKSQQEEILNHPAKPLMKYVGKNNKLPTGPKTAFGKESEQILKELGFVDIKDANKAIADYIEKRDDFVNPLSRIRMKERAAKFLRDKEKIMEEVEKKVRAEGRDRKAKIEAVRDFFYMTDTEIKETIGEQDYRLVSDKQFEEMLKKLEEKSIEIAEHAVAVAEVEWTIMQKELHRVENLQDLMELPKNLKELTTEQLNTLNQILGNFKHGDVFLGVREMETLAKNADLPGVMTQRQILEEVIGKRTNVSMDDIRKITSSQMDKFRSAVSLARQNPFYEIMVNDAYALKVEAGIRYQEVENKINELTKKARESRRRTFIQRLVPTDDMVISYLEEGDLTTKQAIAKDMTKAELELAHYVQGKYAEMRDYLTEREQLDKYRENYFTHRARSFFEAWLRDGETKSPKQFISQFAKAFKEVILDVHKLDQAAFNITNEKTKEILPLEKFFKYSMRRSGQLIPTRNLAKAFLGYTQAFELKRGLDKYVVRMEATARALTPQETTEGGLIKDTSLENFVAQWINTQKGRPLALKFINPGDTLDTLIRAGVAFTRTLDLALRIPAQFMSLVGEESATWINIGNKRYLLGQYRAKTGQGKNISKKYESLVGRTFWDKMKEDSKTFESKLGETMFAFYGIAARNANIHHLLGSLTEQEFKSGEISTKRLGELKQEMTKWRADDVLSSVMGKTSIGQVFRQHKSWAIPIFTQTLSNLQDIKNMVASGEYLQAAKSKQFGELFRATMLTLILVLTLSKWYKDLKDDQDRTLVEELEYRAINDALSFMSALSPKTLFVQPRLMSWVGDLSTAISTLIGAMATGEKTASGKTPGLKEFAKSFTPKIFQGILKDDEEDKIMANISQSVSAAQEKLDVINKDIVEPAKTAWESVKIAGVESDESEKIVNELSYDQYEAYKLVKKADTDYWIDIAKKVTPIVQEAYKVGFGTEEAKPLVSDLNKDEYEMYKKVKTTLYSKEPTIAEKNEWKEQTFLEHVTNIAKGWSTDPVDAFNKLIKGDWQITELKNGQIIVNRLPMDASQKIKEEAAKNNKDWKLDHINAIKSGGGNEKENLNIISTEEWQENTPVEIYVIKKLDTGKITGKQAKEYLIRFKVGRKQIISGKYFEEYKDKPITFEEIKKEIGE